MQIQITKDGHLFARKHQASNWFYINTISSNLYTKVLDVVESTRWYNNGHWKNIKILKRTNYFILDDLSFEEYTRILSLIVILDQREVLNERRNA